MWLSVEVFFFRRVYLFCRIGRVYRVRFAVARNGVASQDEEGEEVGEDLVWYGPRQVESGNAVVTPAAA